VDDTKMIIDCIGCLHGHYPNLEGGDLLILTGDYTARDSLKEWDAFFAWLKKQEYKNKIMIGGNHDNFLLSGFPTCKKDADDLAEVQGFINHKPDFTYLCDSGCVIEGLKIWGSPWTPGFKGVNPKCMAFMMPYGCDTEDNLMDKWELIPDDIDILVTHGPPYSILDGVLVEDGSLYSVGSKSLYSWLKYIERTNLHVFSHIHEGYGQMEYFPTYNNKMRLSVNCSHVNEKYKPVNKPVRVVL
jgi:predicted phosphodiesterase